MDSKEMIRIAEEGKSIKYISPSDLEAALPELDNRGYYIHVLEAHERRGDWEVPITWLSLLGADGDENWENHYDRERNMRLVMEKINCAKKTGLPIFYETWIGIFD